MSSKLKGLQSTLMSPLRPRRTLFQSDTASDSVTMITSFSNEDKEQAHFVFSTSMTSDPGEPKQYRDAMLPGPEKTFWAESIKSEIENFLKRDVWKKFPRAGIKWEKTLKSRWVFKRKQEADNTTRYKARVVVKGYNQIPGVDFTESFAPVATDTTTCIIFAFVLFKTNWDCEIVDVEAAFLNADLDEDLYIDYPEGVVELGFETKDTAINYCILLDKAMYGAVQAARQWSRRLTEIVT